MEQQFERPSDEIELIDLIRVLVKRRWMIVFTTFLVTIAGVALCFILPQKYDVSFLLELGQDAYGHAVVSPQSVKMAIDNDAYSNGIRTKLSLDEKTGIKFKIQAPKGTELLYANYKTAQPDLGLAVSQQLVQFIDADVAKKLKQKRGRLKNELALAEIQKDSWQEKINICNAQIDQQRKSVDDLKKMRQLVMDTPSHDSVAVLLYSNEIKSGFEYMNQLKEKLSEYKAEILTATIEVQMINATFDNLQGVYVYKKPTVSDKPVSPKKPLIVALAFMLGLMGSVMLAFLLEYLYQHKDEKLAS